MSNDKINRLVDTVGEDDTLRVLEYEALRQRVVAAFKGLGHGSQVDAASDLGMTKATVSSILNGHYIRPAELSRLAGWVDGRGAPAGVAG